MNYLSTETKYIAERECLLLTADMSDYLIDYYIHLKEEIGAVKPEHDEKLKQLIIFFALHLSAKPPGDTFAWTLHFHDENPYSLFVTGNAATKYIVGHVITENIRHADVNTFHAQVSNAKGEASRSSIQCESSNIKEMLEDYYNKSEQLSAKFSMIENSDCATMILAMPEHDEAWFKDAEFKTKESTEGIGKKLNSNQYSFNCGCGPEKLLPFLRSIEEKDLEELYGSDEELLINCPRCGKKFTIKRTELGTQAS